MSPAASRACEFVRLVAQAHPDKPDDKLHEAIVTNARKIVAEIRREQDHTSRSGVPLTRKA